MDDWMERYGVVVRPPAEKRCVSASHRDFETWAEETVTKIKASEEQNRLNPDAPRALFTSRFRCDYVLEESGEPAFTPKLRRIAEAYPELKLCIVFDPQHKNINIVVVTWMGVANGATVPHAPQTPDVDLPAVTGTSAVQHRDVNELKFDGKAWSV